MRLKHSLLVIVAASMFAPAFLHSQFGRGQGGGPGGGFGAPDPNKMFDWMSKGKDVVNRADLDPRSQGMFDRFAQMANITNGTMTREQFVSSMEKMANTMKMNGPMGGGSFGGGGMGGGGRGFGGGGPPAMTQGDRNGGGSGGERNGSDRNGGPSLAAAQAEERRAEEFFKRSDKNNDGLLSFEEMSERLKPLREKFDKNGDGFISLEEYKPFLAEQFAQFNTNNPTPPDRGGPPMANQEANGDNRGGPMVTVVTPDEKEEEIRRPTLFRVGKLPKDLPSWFEELDKDLDGQVGLYEWRKDSRDIQEFEGMDFNGDGLLTPEEVLKFFKLTDEDKKKAAANNRGPGSSAGGRMGSGSMGNGGGDFANRWGNNGGNSGASSGGGNGGADFTSRWGGNGGGGNNGGEQRQRGNKGDFGGKGKKNG